MKWSSVEQARVPGADWYLRINLKARQLRLLATLDAYRNLTQAAEAIHVTLSAVSKSLAELERGLGFLLFSRTAQGLVPTPHGECLVRHARTVLSTLQQAGDELRALSRRADGRLRIGMLPASASVLLPQALLLLKQQSPGINATVIEGTTATLLPELSQGRLDLVVGRLPPPDMLEGLEGKELFYDPIMLITGPHHPLAGKKTLKWPDLRAYPWILPPSGSMLRTPLERALEARGLFPADNHIETRSVSAARMHLLGSDSIAAMGGSHAGDAVRPLHVLPLRLPRLLRPAGYLWNRGRGLTPSAQILASCLGEAAARM